jgi:hypothetical protein
MAERITAVSATEARARALTAAGERKAAEEAHAKAHLDEVWKAIHDAVDRGETSVCVSGAGYYEAARGHFGSLGFRVDRTELRPGVLISWGPNRSAFGATNPWTAIGLGALAAVVVALVDALWGAS